MPYIFASKSTAMASERIVNIIDGADGCCIMIYGDIGFWGTTRPDDIVKELMSAESADRKIDVRINSVGGEVYAALAIFNALRASRADITIYVDCLAASAASVIAGCGRPVKMASNGRMMIHSVRGYAEGTVEEIKNSVAEMEQLEDILCDIYARRTGLDTETVRASYFDGKDHWFTAEEALRLGLVDEIFEAEPIAVDSFYEDSDTPRRICDAFTRKYINSLDMRNINEQNMLATLKSRPRFSDCADEAAAVSRIEELENLAVEAEALRSERDALRAERDNLQAENDGFRERETEAREAEIRNTAHGYVTAGLIAADQEENAASWLRADEEKAKAYFGSLKPKPRIMDRIDGGFTAKTDPLEQRKEEVRKRLESK